MGKNPITKVGAVVVGMLLLVGPSFGFSSFAADRGTDIRTATDSNAYLGIESAGDVSGTELRADSDPLRVGTLVNNVDESLEVQDVTIQSTGDGSVDGSLLAVASPTTGDTIAAGDATDVTVECAAKQSVGPQNIVVRVDGVEGTTIRIAEPTFNASDVTTDSTMQTISFISDGLGNKGVATIDFSDPQDDGGVDYSSVTDADLTVQGGKGDASFDSQSSQLTYTIQGNEKGRVTIEHRRRRAGR